MSTDVSRLSAAAQALVAIETPQDALDAMNLADMARTLARKMKLGAEAENAATSIRIKAEIRLAETVTEGQERGEIATAAHGGANVNGVRTSDTVPPATLADIGVTRQRLSEARDIAAAFTLPAIDGMAADASERDTTLTRAAVLREARHEASERFDQMADGLLDQTTKDRHAIDRAAADLHGALAALESLGRPVREAEAAPLLPTMHRLQQKLHGNRSARLEVVS